MNLKGQNIKKSLFSEWRTIDTAQSAASIFDITHDQEPTLENYCIALLEKVFTIPQSPNNIHYTFNKPSTQLINSDSATSLTRYALAP